MPVTVWRHTGRNCGLDNTPRNDLKIECSSRMSTLSGRFAAVQERRQGNSPQQPGLGSPRRSPRRPQSAEAAAAAAAQPGAAGLLVNKPRLGVASFLEHSKGCALAIVCLIAVPKCTMNQVSGKVDNCSP
jgi:hypothetical protein